MGSYLKSIMNHYLKQMHFKTYPCTVHTCLDVCVATINQFEKDFYLESIKASLQIRPVLVFLAGGSVELAPPVHELLFLLVT